METELIPPPVPTPESAQPTPVPESSKNHGWFWGLVVVLVLAAGYAGAAYFMDVWPFPLGDLISEPPSPSPTVEPTAGWDTYHDDQYGFGLKFPGSWSEYQVEPITPALQGTTAVFQIWNHPLVSPSEERAYIEVLVFSLAQWGNELSLDQPHPIELGRDTQYVYAHPFRYDFLGLPGEEDIDSIYATFRLLP